MSSLFNAQLPQECYDKWCDDLASITTDLGFPFHSNTLPHDLVDPSGLITSPNLLQNPLPSFNVEPTMESLNETTNFFISNPCLSVSNLQPFNPGNSEIIPSSCYSTTIPLSGPKNNYSLHQESQVPSFSDFPLVYPSEFTPVPPSNLDTYTGMSSLFGSNGQCINDQALLHQPINIGVKDKHVSSVFNYHPCPEITPWSSLIRNETNDFPRLVGNSRSISLDDKPINNGSLFHRLNREGISAIPTGHFNEPNEQKSGVSQTTMSQAYVGGGMNCLTTETLLKRKSPEGGKEEEEVKKGNIHQCKLCNMSFRTGNALGGHMSYHAKKKKLEAQRITQVPKQPNELDMAFARGMASRFRDSVPLSMNTFRW